MLSVNTSTRSCEYSTTFNRYVKQQPSSRLSSLLFPYIFFGWPLSSRKTHPEIRRIGVITKTKEDRTCTSGRIDSIDCCTYILIILIRDKKRERGGGIKRGRSWGGECLQDVTKQEGPRNSSSHVGSIVVQPNLLFKY